MSQIHFILEQLVNGLTLGSLYALTAIGLALVVGVLRLINFAHGDLFMIGGYLFFLTRQDGAVPYWLATLATVAGMMVLGYLFERAVIERVLDKSWRVQLIATLAISVILVNAFILYWGLHPKMAPTAYATRFWELGMVRVAAQRILVFVVALVAFALFGLFLQHTRTGRAMRAISQSREACLVVGVDPHRIAGITFAISAGLAGLASALVVPLYSVSPVMGTLLTLKALAAVIMGGFGQIRGTLVASYLLGVTEALAAGFISSSYADLVVFGVMVLTLLLRPQGLFGRKVGI
ncbi:MAG: branched-chain amino acid ABC transporter permease [Armatimonadota bacterium]|nr:branched-chain amino acid ABC transporter permease [Armatimonadota bacterium]